MHYPYTGGQKVTKLEDYARAGKYLKWVGTDIHHIALDIQFDGFKNMEPVLSDRHGTDQYEVPIIVQDVGQTLYQSILATKSKDLLVKLLNIWQEDPRIVVRLHKEGTGFYTKWSVDITEFRYDKASGKVTKQPAKKK